jgi:hypothetical protein
MQLTSDDHKFDAYRLALESYRHKSGWKVSSLKRLELILKSSEANKRMEISLLRFSSVLNYLYSYYLFPFPYI